MLEAEHGQSDRYYIRIRGRISGPFDVDQLQRMSSRGQLGRMHELSADRIEWRRADEILAETRAVAQPYRQSAHALPAEQEGGIPLSPEQPSAHRPAPDSGQWYYNRGQESVGPVPFAVMQDLIRNRILTGDTLVWNQSMEHWQPAAMVFGLSTLVTSAEPENKSTSKCDRNEPQEYRRVSAMAVTSLILGILWLWGLGSIMAIVFGSVALYQIRLSRGRMVGAGLAIAGLVLGLVFLGFQLFAAFYWQMGLLLLQSSKMN